MDSWALWPCVWGDDRRAIQEGWHYRPKLHHNCPRFSGSTDCGIHAKGWSDADGFRHREALSNSPGVIRFEKRTGKKKKRGKEEEKKNSDYGLWFSLLLITDALFVPTVATVPSPTVQEHTGDWFTLLFCFLFRLFPCLFFVFPLTLDYVNYVVKANFLQKDIYIKK